MKSSYLQGRTVVSQKKKPGRYEHTLPISYTDQKSGLQSDMLQLCIILFFLLYCQEKDALPNIDRLWWPAPKLHWLSLLRSLLGFQDLLDLHEAQQSGLGDQACQLVALENQ